MWPACGGSKFDEGNRNIKILTYADFFLIKIRYPLDGSWLYAKAYFGKRRLPLLLELYKLARERKKGCDVIISLRDRPRVLIQVLIWLYLEHLPTPKPIEYELIVFEGLTRIKTKRYVNSPTANRKIARFAKE